MKKSDIRQMKRDIEKALEAVAKKYDVEIKTGRSASYTGSASKVATVSLKLEAVANGADSVEEASYRLNARTVGLKPEWLNVPFKGDGGRVLKIVGFNTRARKYPVCLQDNSGQRSKAAPEFVLQFAEQLDS